MKTVRSGGGLSAADVFPGAGSWHSFRMGMGIRQGETITVTAEGEDEAAAIEAVEKFLTENV